MEDQIVHDRWGQLGFDNLLPEEKDHIMIWWLVAEVNNGTFSQFSNETGDHALQALDGLKKCRFLAIHFVFSRDSAAFQEDAS